MITQKRQQNTDQRTMREHEKRKSLTNKKNQEKYIMRKTEMWSWKEGPILEVPKTSQKTQAFSREGKLENLTVAKTTDDPEAHA